MKREYRNLMENIQVPEGLADSVLSAAQEVSDSKNTACRRFVRRVAVCAMLALVLVLGGVMPKPRSEVLKTDEAGALVCTMGLVAYAADSRQAANGNLVLGGRESPVIQTTVLTEAMQFTENRFRIQGLNITELILHMDRGGIYRAKSGGGDVLPAPAVEPYDPDAVYGLWVPFEELEEGRGYSILDGALLTVTARFTNGTEQTNTYRITKQRLLVSRNEDGTEVLVPALEGSGQEDISGLYLESLSSVWLQWPVEGSNTVSLSNRYGYRVGPGGMQGSFHAGIDIPAESGTAVRAAAAGTVITAEFDVDKGNYVVIDHDNGMETVYAHCLSLSVEAGDTVEAGQEIAAVGSTGKSTGPHLCFQVWQDGKAQNPVAYFDSVIRDTLSMG